MSIYLNHMDFRRLEPLRQPPGGGGGGVPRLRHRFKFNQTDCLGASHKYVTCWFCHVLPNNIPINRVSKEWAKYTFETTKM